MQLASAIAAITLCLSAHAQTPAPVKIGCMAELSGPQADALIEKEKVAIVTGLTFSNVMMAVTRKLTSAGVVVVGSNAGPAPLAGAQCSPRLGV